MKSFADILGVHVNEATLSLRYSAILFETNIAWYILDDSYTQNVRSRQIVKHFFSNDLKVFEITRLRVIDDKTAKCSRYIRRLVTPINARGNHSKSAFCHLFPTFQRLFISLPAK